MTTYHLMVEEDVSVCGSYGGASLTYREDVADCPECWRKMLVNLREKYDNMEKMKNALAKEMIKAVDMGKAFEEEAKDWHKLADERSAALNAAIQERDDYKSIATEEGFVARAALVQSAMLTMQARVKLLEETLSAFPGLNSDTEDVIKWINKVSKVIG